MMMMMMMMMMKEAVSQYTMKTLSGRGSIASTFTISALDASEWLASRPGRALPPGKAASIQIGQEAVWALEPVWTQKLEEKSSYLCLGSSLDRPDTILTELPRLLVFSIMYRILKWKYGLLFKEKSQKL
jgi:hypothetical protein